MCLLHQPVKAQDQYSITSLNLWVNFFTAAQLPPSSGFFLGKCALCGMCVGMTCTVWGPGDHVSGNSLITSGYGGMY